MFHYNSSFSRELSLYSSIEQFSCLHNFNRHGYNVVCKLTGSGELNFGHACI